jgi:hypothetical protein
MSSFFDEASLVMIPSGYKDQKVYSVKPLDGSGDLTFSRASSATRVASNGLIEKVRTNLVTYSQDFSNVSYVIDELSRTGGQTDPNGGTTASLFTATAAVNAYILKDFSTASGSIYTFSIYIKGAASGSVSLRVDSGGTAAANNINYTTSWQRFTYTFTAGAATSTMALGGYNTWTGTEAISIAFAQAETGDIATDYIATTSAAVSVGPVSGLPRLDYLNSTCPRLLLEPQRSNVCVYSEQINNAAWGQTSVGGTLTVTANYGISPDGYQNADRIQASVTTGYADIVQPVSISSGAAYTYSVYLKSLSGTPTICFFNDGTANRLVTLTTEWKRYTFTISSSGSLAYPRFLIENNVTSQSADFLAWGAQLEAGAYATSYIPTLGTSVTRVADAASKTGISSLIGQTEGTLFVEVNAPSGFDGNNLMATLSDGTTSNMVFINRVSGRAEYYVASGGVEQAAFASASVLTTGVHKLAVAYKQNDFAFYVDGVLLHSDTSGSVPAMNRINLGSYVAGALPYNDRIVQAIVFPTRLSNSDLAALTA